MNYKRIFGIAIIVIGIAAIGGAVHVQLLIDEGKGKIEDAQKAVEEGTFLLGLHPVSKRITQNATEKAQGQIDEATAMVNEYEQLVKYGIVGGGLFVIGGTILVIFSRKKHR